MTIKNNEKHPIQPSKEQVQQWRAEIPSGVFDGYAYPQRETELCIQAAQWGAEQELHAICDWLDHGNTGLIHPLLCARRPKPPSLRKQAYDALDTYIYGEPDPKDKERTYNTICRALEALPND